MGTIYDFEQSVIINQPAKTRPRGNATASLEISRLKPRRTISTATPIIPPAIALAVLEEASAWLDTPLPQHWIGKLAERAETVYARNARFRQLINGRGNVGRDWLWAFTRHWLSGLLAKHRPDLAARLPSHFKIGRDLTP